MSKPQPSINRDVAAAMRAMAKRTGQNEPSVRGADWRLARVSAVHTGTVEVEDAPGIRIRRLATYTSPAVGDVIVITGNSAGNWLAFGRTATGA